MMRRLDSAQTLCGVDVKSFRRSTMARTAHGAGVIGPIAQSTSARMTFVPPRAQQGRQQNQRNRIEGKRTVARSTTAMMKASSLAGRNRPPWTPTIACRW